LRCTRDFLATGKWPPVDEPVNTVENSTNRVVTYLPLVPFTMIGGGRLEQAIREAEMRGVLHKTSFAPSGEGFVFRVIDKSMEPTVRIGSYVTIDKFLMQEPGDFIIVELKNGIVLFREFLYRGKNIILSPQNQNWREEELTPKEWENSVKIHGVMISFETRWRHRS
jgi:SOS-response transcriptional repressor LexA